MSSLRPVSGTSEEILALLREWDAAETPEPLMIETSGSSGLPKRVLLSRDALRASANATHERLGGPGRWVLNLPPSYVAGVQVLYRSVVAGTDPVVMHHGLAALRGQITSRTYLSLVPTQLVRILRAEDRDQLKALVEFDRVLVGGGPLSPAVRARAESYGVRIVQTYGMSETCGGCVYDGVPLAGVEVRIEEDHVLLRGPVLFEGYEGEPERSAAAYRDGWLVTHDVGRLDEEGRLHVDGRADDVIISGGVKVPGGAVREMLHTAPGLHDVEVVGVPDPEWGERVVALVAASDPVSLDHVRSLVEPRAWAPRQLVIVERLPLLANGKPDRLAMRKLARDA